MALAVLLRGALLAMRDHAAAQAGRIVQERVRAEVLDTLEQLGPLRAAAGDDGALATLATERVEALDGYFSRYLPQRLTLALVLPLLLALVLPLSWMAALIFVATAPVIPLFMSLVGRGAAAASQRQANALARLGGQFLDMVRGLATLRLLGAVPAAASRLAVGIEAYRMRTMGVLRLAFLSSMVLELFASVSIAMVALYLGLSLLGRLHLGHYGEPMTLAPALFMLMLAPEFYAPLRQLGADYHARADALASAQAIISLKARLGPPPIEPATSPLPAPDAPLLEFSRAGLRHADGRIALQDLDLRIHAGERIALRGASGSGKSTLLALAAGLIAPTSGSLRGDGLPLSPSRWWPRLAWLEQRPEWFALSIRDNVMLGMDRNDEARLWQALERAGLADVVRTLPRGADSVVGADGALSGGQLQRLALARALARKADVWLLDEPFAQLDAETAAHLEHTLAMASTGCTVLMATHETHDPHWIDRVLHLDEGRLQADESRARKGNP